MMETTDTTPTTERYVKIDEVAARTQLAPTTISQYVSKGKVPYYKYRRYHVRFLLSEIDLWMVGDLAGGFRGHVPASANVAA